MRHEFYGARFPSLSFRGAKRRGNLLQPVTFSPRPTCYPTWYCEIATSAYGLLAMTSRRCVPFEQRPELIGSACRALSVTFGDSSPRGRAKVASLLGMTRQGGPAVGTVHCIEFAVLLPLRGRERHAAPLQWRVRSAILPGNLQLPMALATRKGHAASVRRQSRQRLRRERRYSQIWQRVRSAMACTGCNCLPEIATSLCSSQ